MQAKGTGRYQKKGGKTVLSTTVLGESGSLPENTSSATKEQGGKKITNWKKDPLDTFAVRRPIRPLRGRGERLSSKVKEAINYLVSGKEHNNDGGRRDRGHLWIVEGKAFFTFTEGLKRPFKVEGLRIRGGEHRHPSRAIGEGGSRLL